MKIPAQLKIGGQVIKIVVTEDTPDDNNGFWDSRKSTIYLHKKMPPAEMQITLLHETIHAINNSIDHREVEYLTQAIYQVMADNQLFFDGKADA